MECKKYTVTRLVDVNLLILTTLMEAILGQLMEVLIPAKLQFKSLVISLMVVGLFSGLGLEALLRWEITILAQITLCLEEFLSELSNLHSSMEEITLILDRINANSSIQIDFMCA
jgi:hypothetical protein